MAERIHASFSLFNHPNDRLSLRLLNYLPTLSLSAYTPRQRHLSALLTLSHLTRRSLSSLATLLVRPSSRAVSLSHDLSLSLSLPSASRWRSLSNTQRIHERGKDSRREDVRTEGRREKRCRRRTEPTKRERTSVRPARGEKEPA